MKKITEYKAEIKDRNLIKLFIFAGKAIFTIQSRESGEHFTYKITQLIDHSSNLRKDVWFVKVLTGPDNSSNYTFIGTIFADKSTYVHSKKTRIGSDALSVKTLDWFIRHLSHNSPKLDQCVVYHEGVCARCGRKLTQPQSLNTGFGKECAGYAGIEWKSSTK